MPRAVVNVSSRTYEVALEDVIPAARRLQVLVRARLVDECMGGPVRSDMGVTCGTAGVVGHVGRDGLVGLIGFPSAALSTLETQARRLIIVFSAEGYVPHPALVELAPQSAFPGSFVPVDLGDIPMHRCAVVASGRMIEDDGTARTPIPGGTVRVREFWPTQPTLLGGAPEPPNLMAIAPPLYAARDSAAGAVRRRGTVAGGPARRITQAAAAGQSRIGLEQCPELNAGDVVEIEFTDIAFPQHDPARIEYLAVHAIERPAPTLPARLTLEHALAFDHRPDMFVRRVTLQPPGVDLPLTRDALTGDECLFTTALTDLSGGGTVEVRGDVDFDGNPLPAEFHRVFLYSTVTGADGFFRLPPLARVAQVTLEFTIGAFVGTRSFNPEYVFHENRADFVRAV